MIPIYKPYISKYKGSAINAIESEWISNHGIYINLATNKLCNLLGVKYCVLMNNGTSATHCLFRALKFKHPNLKKIYLPNYVFIAPWNCGLQEYTSDMFEVMKTDPKTMNIDTTSDYILSLDKDSAIVIVHNLGNIVNVPRLKRLRPDLIFVEDNCEGLFGKYESMYTGSFSGTFCSSVSFYGNKTITTGEGGAFFTNDLEVYNYIKTYYSHGMSDKRYIHSMLGTNYRMTNVQAALLYEQINDIQHILNLKKEIFNSYENLFKQSKFQERIEFLQIEENTEKSNWIFPIKIKNISYSELENFMLEKNIQIRPFFYDYKHHSHLSGLKSSESNEQHVHSEWGIMIPSYPELKYEEQEYIVFCIDEFLLLSNLKHT